MIRLPVCFALMALLATPLAWATNGLNLNSYGPASSGAGGAAMAYDFGPAASAMVNPATMGLMSEGNRFDVGAIFLGPDLTSDTGAASAKSTATAFWLPQLGYIHKAGGLAFGAVVAPSGGMGSEYAADSFVALGSGDVVRSESLLLRFIAPVSYSFSPDLSVGASLDYGRGGLESKMALSGLQFFDMITPSQQSGGAASGSMIASLKGAMGAGLLDATAPINWVRFDFSDDSAITQAASGSGFGGKLGAVYKVMPGLTLGASYHTALNLGDMKATGAKVSMNAKGMMCGGPNAVCTIPISGDITVKDFKWPSMYGFGAAYQALQGLTLVGDYKLIGWKSTMDSIKIGFQADQSQENASAQAIVGGGGTAVDAEMYQRWENQHVVALGAVYQLNEPITLRAGVNFANNPIPEELTNPLFPATLKSAYTVGVGYAFTPASSLDASFEYAPIVTATNKLGVSPKAGGLGSQFAYSLRF